MPTYVYMSANTQSDVAIQLHNTGPNDEDWNRFKDVRASVPRTSTHQRVMTVDRTASGGDHTIIAELRFYIDGVFIIALEVMLTAGNFTNEIYWSWRTATKTTGRFVTDHDPHTTTVPIGGWTYTFTVKGKGTIGFDDIYVSLQSTLDRAKWMEILASRIGTRPLNEVRIPGTHDSGTSSITSTSPWAPDSEWWQTFNRGTVAAWSRTQSRGIGNQLLDGIRYFDFRIAPSANGQGYSLIHALQGDDIQASLNAIRDFLRNSTKEIIILDFNTFLNMQPADHNALVTIINNILGTYIIHPSVGVTITLNTLWASSQRIIVAYADDTTVDNNPQTLWRRQNAATSTVSSPWPDTDDIQTLHNTLTNNLANRTFAMFFVLQSILTPGAIQILWTNNSLEQWATQVTNPEVANWVVNEWNLQRPNIIMCDFYEVNDIAGRVINLNL